MGLASARRYALLVGSLNKDLIISRRAKLSSDPNNTVWSRSSTTYGRKILQSHGWTPGSFLGAGKTLQSASDSAAGLQHLKVAFKDDNLGLGAKGLANDECTGLNAFQRILESLNGRGQQQLQEQEKVRQGPKYAINQQRSMEAVHFVSGGFLEGSKQEELAERSARETMLSGEDYLLKRKDNARQVQHQLGFEENKTNPRTPSSKFSVKSTRPPLDEPARKSDESCTSHGPVDSCTEARRIRKAERRILRRKVDEAIQRSLVVSPPESGSLIPVATVTSHLPISQSNLPPGGRHAVRLKYIRHKKMAMMDSKAMNEVSQASKVQ